MHTKCIPSIHHIPYTKVLWYYTQPISQSLFSLHLTQLSCCFCFVSFCLVFWNRVLQCSPWLLGNCGDLAGLSSAAPMLEIRAWTTTQVLTQGWASPPFFFFFFLKKLHFTSQLWSSLPLLLSTHPLASLPAHHYPLLQKSNNAFYWESTKHGTLDYGKRKPLSPALRLSIQFLKLKVFSIPLGPWTGFSLHTCSQIATLRLNISYNCSLNILGFLLTSSTCKLTHFH